MPTDREDAIAGCLLGGAIGDAIGLPREGLSPARARSMFGPTRKHAFFFGRGMLSDDTEQTSMVIQSWLACRGDPDRFGRSLAWGLRWWLAALPAGVGLGTARAIVRLWLGWPWRRAGSSSAGNGAAMRAAPLGLLCPEEKLETFVEANTVLTHRDPRARRAALLVAIAIRYGATHGGTLEPKRFLSEARARLGDDTDEELEGLLQQIESHLARGSTLREFAAAIGAAKGVSGYAYRTVPVALYAWLRDPSDYRRCVAAVIDLGGDADTTGSITGALVGATVGAAALPQDWLDGIGDLPRSVSWLRRLAHAAACDAGPVKLPWPLIPVRNLAFLVIVLAHGVRRLFPPYG